MARATWSRLGRTARWLRRFGPSASGGASTETLSLVASAIVVGAMAGLAAVGFDRLVHAVSDLVILGRDRLGMLPTAVLTVLTPAVGGLLVAPIVVRWAPDARGSGISNVMVAVSNLGGRVPRRLLFWRPLASALTVGSGGSLGPEGPVVQIGAAIASLFSSWFRLGDERRRNLAAVAAGGAIAATFNAPIAGALFALEEILGKFEGRNFSSVVIGAVAATAVSRSMRGDAPAFGVPAGYTLGSPLELPLYLVMGLLAAVLAVATIRVLIGSEDLLDRWRVNPWLRPALGGLAVGSLALALPEVLGRGYDTIGGILNGDVTAPVLLAGIMLGKLFATGASIGSWGSGGILAPTLMIGAAFGALFGSAAQALFPALGIRPGAYGLVGMAAVFAGVTRAPMSSIVMVFELSGSYQMILPLLFAAVIATLAADLLGTDSYYEMMLARRGLSLVRSRDTDLLQTVTVGEVMSRDVPTVAAEDTVRDLADTLVASHDHGFVVTPRAEPERMIGIVTLTDLERARRDEMPGNTPIRDFCSCDVELTYPEEPASAVLERMAALGIGRMPVVRRNAPDRPVGMVRQSDLARAYYLALQRERAHDEVHGRLRLRDLTGQEIVEVRVPRGSRLAGTTLREAQLPHDSIVVAIRRGTRTLFPHGETTIEAGDTVVANVAPGFGPGFRELITDAGERPAEGPREAQGA